METETQEQESSEKREKFKELLFELAISQKSLDSDNKKDEFYRKLEDIYYEENESNIFRHYYSDIFAVISQIDKDAKLGNIEILSQNMEIIRQDYTAKNYDVKGNLIDINKQINKIYDHINLEIARMNYFKETESETKEKLNEVNSALNDIKTNVSMANDVQKQYITILGIFAAIVLAFTGGMAFSTSVLDNIANASIYRITFVTVIIAFVLTNIIYILTHFIMKISSRNPAKLKYPKYMIVLNIVYGCLIFLDILCWMLDMPKAVILLQNTIY